MNWKKFLDSLTAADTVEPTLPEVSEEEAMLYCEAITRATGGMDGEPRKVTWEKRYGEDWSSWLKRSASQQPRREPDDE